MNNTEIYIKFHDFCKIDLHLLLENVSAQNQESMTNAKINQSIRSLK